MIDPSHASDRIVLAVVRDLIFASRITAAAKTAGVEARILRDPAMLTDIPGSLLLADLNQPGVIEAASKWKNACAGRVVGFVSHVDTATITAARNAGLNEVMARSAFVKALPDLIQHV